MGPCRIGTFEYAAAYRAFIEESLLSVANDVVPLKLFAESQGEVWLDDDSFFTQFNDNIELFSE